VDLSLLAYEAAPKALFYTAVVVALGLAMTRVLVARAGELAPELAVVTRWALARLLLGAAAALLAALAARLVGHTLAAFGPVDGLTADALRTIGLESRWGDAWRWQGGAAILLLAAAPFAASAAPLAWLPPLAAALGVAAVVPLLGHGAESPGATVLHAAHVVAAGLWLGTLVAMLLVERRMRKGYGVTAAHHLYAALVPRFSPLAVFASTLVLVSGIVAVLEYVPTPSALVTTFYGRTLLVKLALVGVVGACGFANWQAVLAGRTPTRRLMTVEASAALAIVAVTALLTESEPPALP
jgi:putative copper resistance protein D